MVVEDQQNAPLDQTEMYKQFSMQMQQINENKQGDHFDFEQD